MDRPKWILPVIVISQFCCTSLWFASNGVMTDLVKTFALKDSALGLLTSAVQFGFILGTLLSALLTIVDRFSPSKVFFMSAFLGALFNAGVVWGGNGLTTLLILRFFTGIFLAGIYPVGLKIAADYYEKGLEKSMGFLVGALVVGTAFPHFLNGVTDSLPWISVVLTTSFLAILGGLLMVFMIPDGPYRKSSQQVELSAFFNVFRNRDFRSAAIGYFGHMWELYAFWAFVPVILMTYNTIHPQSDLNIPLWSFFIIGIGGLACVLGGYLSQTKGTNQTAYTALLLSGICCIISPWMFSVEFESLFIAFLLIWGMTVVADSPLFSTLVAQNASNEFKGTALTIVNSIGFAITIISIQTISEIREEVDPTYLYVVLALGPILGLIAKGRKRRI